MLNFKFEYHPSWLAKAFVIIGPVAVAVLIAVVGPRLESHGISQFISIPIGVIILLLLTFLSLRKFRNHGRMVLHSDKVQLFQHDRKLEIPFSDLKQIKESGIWTGYHVKLILHNNERFRVDCIQHFFSDEEALYQAVKHLKRNFEAYRKKDRTGFSEETSTPSKST